MGDQTTPLRGRDGDNRNQAGRLKQMKKGPGWFVYRGGHVVVTQTPTILRERIRVPKEVNGKVVLDALNRIQYEYVDGDPVLNHKKQAQMGGPPIYTKTELEVVSLPHPDLVDDKRVFVDFPKGEKVYVANAKVALKARCLPYIDEVNEDTEIEAPRKRKGKTEE